MLHSDGDYEDISGDGGVLKKRSTDTGKSHTKPTDGVEVGIFYVGTLLNGREFDSNRTFGSGYSKPLNYVIGSGKMVAGMDIALKSMNFGEVAQFRLRSDYGYGDKGSPGRGTSPDIPPGATICFELEVVDLGEVKPSASAVRKAEEKQRLAEITAAREQAALEQLQATASKKSPAAVNTPKNSDAVVVDPETPVVQDTRWAKSLKPNDLKAQLKLRNLSTQGSKKELLARLLDNLGC